MGIDRRLIFNSDLPPGDDLMLSAAVRDLHLTYPGRFETDVRTPSMALWENNPYLTPLNEDDGDVTVMDCHYPVIRQCRTTPVHFVEGFTRYLNSELDLEIQTHRFGGDVHLSQAEKSASSPVEHLIGEDTPYWIVVAGGKFDYTVKWWHRRNYQRVVDVFKDRVRFVQVGRNGDFHPPLDGVVDFRGETEDLRDLIRLVYRADGVLCPITFLMHLCAAVEMPEGREWKRPCVVVAGGREPPSWPSYPFHQFIHTIGALACCGAGGCWKSRTLPLNDGRSQDAPDQLCVDVIDRQPRCMHMIDPSTVVSRIELYYEGGLLRYSGSRNGERNQKTKGG